MVTNDDHTLKCLMNGESNRPVKVNRVISIDDSGVGFLLGGVLCGIYDSETDKVKTAAVDAKYFQGESKDNKMYLDEYSKACLKLVEELNPDKKTTLIKICTGYINSKAKDDLRKNGYYVEVCEIKGRLQDELEYAHKNYLDYEFGYRDYFDPKGASPKELANEFRKVKKWVIMNNLRHCCKDNWGKGSKAKKAIHKIYKPKFSA